MILFHFILPDCLTGVLHLGFLKPLEPAVLDLSLLQSCIPWESFKQDPEQAKVFSSEVQGCDSTVYLVPSFQYFECHLFIVSAAKAAPKLYIPEQSFPVFKRVIQQSV